MNRQWKQACQQTAITDRINNSQRKSRVERSDRELQLLIPAQRERSCDRTAETASNIHLHDTAVQMSENQEQAKNDQIANDRDISEAGKMQETAEEMREPAQNRKTEKMTQTITFARVRQHTVRVSNQALTEVRKLECRERCIVDSNHGCT